MLNSSLKNVVVVGFGDGGTAVLQAFINNKSEFNVHLLTRRDLSDPTVSQYQSQGVTILQGDLKDKASLVSALKDMDAVISFAGTGVIEDQITLIDACIEAGVKRFYPSEFGTDTTKDEIAKEKVFSSKRKVLDYLLPKAKEGKISYTLIICGSWADPGWSSKGGNFLGFDIKDHSVTIYGDGNTKTTYSSLASVGAFTVASLRNPSASENQILYVDDFHATQNEVLAEFEKATSTKWSVKNVSIEYMKKACDEAFSAGDEWTAYYYGILAAIYGGQCYHEKLDNSKFREVKIVSLSELVQSVL